MKHILGLTLLSVFLFSCGKDKFTTVPQIKFNSLKPNTFRANTLNTDPQPPPILSIQVTDAEGDFGFSDNKDTSYVYIKNLTIPPFKTDSVRFPTSLIKKNNLNAEVEVNLFSTSAVAGIPGRPRPYRDTVFLEIYVKDFAKNKSNVIKSETPLYVFAL